jgi:hypothetical protein
MRESKQMAQIIDDGYIQEAEIVVREGISLLPKDKEYTIRIIWKGTRQHPDFPDYTLCPCCKKNLRCMFNR